jgi:hypothetical protein
VDSIPSITFEVHDADFRSFRNDHLRNEFLARQGMTLVETYGDSRWQLQHPATDSLPPPQ